MQIQKDKLALDHELMEIQKVEPVAIPFSKDQIQLQNQLADKIFNEDGDKDMPLDNLKQLITQGEQPFSKQITKESKNLLKKNRKVGASPYEVNGKSDIED